MSKACFFACFKEKSRIGEKSPVQDCLSFPQKFRMYQLEDTFFECIGKFYALLVGVAKKTDFPKFEPSIKSVLDHR
jgi:hypothetical protein